MGAWNRGYRNGTDFKDNWNEIQLNLKITFKSFRESAVLDKISSAEIEKRILDSQNILKEYLYNKITWELQIDTDYINMWLWEGDIEIEKNE